MLSKIKHIIIVVVDLCYRPFKRYIAQDIFRYGFVGGMNMVLNTVLYGILYNFVFNQNIVAYKSVVQSGQIHRGAPHNGRAGGMALSASVSDSQVSLV